MSPFIHSRIHAKRYGGKPEDYSDIDEFIDSSGYASADIRHRVVLHNSFGAYIAEQVFGKTRVNSEGKEYAVRQIVLDHIEQDLGFVPTLDHYLKNMQIQPWMSGTEKRANPANRFKKIKFEQPN